MGGPRRKSCMNCSADLDTRETQSSFYTLNCSSRVKSSLHPDTVELVPVPDALATIFNFEALKLLTQTDNKSNSPKVNQRGLDVDTGSPLKDFEISASSVPICFVCYMVLSDLYRTYTEFSQLRKANSFLGSKLLDLENRYYKSQGPQGEPDHHHQQRQEPARKSRRSRNSTNKRSNSNQKIQTKRESKASLRASSAPATDFVTCDLPYGSDTDDSHCLPVPVQEEPIVTVTVSTSPQLLRSSLGLHEKHESSPMDFVKVETCEDSEPEFVGDDPGGVTEDEEQSQGADLEEESMDIASHLFQLPSAEAAPLSIGQKDPLSTLTLPLSDSSPSKTKRRKKGTTYTAQDLKNAISAVKNNEKLLRDSSKFYKIPYSTLLLHVKGWKSRPVAVHTSDGRPTALSLEVEKDLAHCLSTVMKWGFSLTRMDVMELVGQHVETNGLSNPFKNGIPGKEWYSRFSKQWGLVCRKPETIFQSSLRNKQPTPFVINEFYNALANTLKSLGLEKSPARVFNIGETSTLPLQDSRTSLQEPGKFVFRQSSEAVRRNPTVTCCVSASGEKLPPFIVYKGKNIWDAWKPNEAFPKTGYAANPEGLMTDKTFEIYFKQFLVPQLPKERPILILWDGNGSQISLDVMKYAISEGITLFNIPNHTTHLLQPLEKYVFESVKASWDDELQLWQSENYGRALGKDNFSILFGRAWEKLSSDTIRSGFRLTGVFDDRLNPPVNSSVIPDSVYDSVQLKNYNKYISERIASISNNEQTMLIGHSMTSQEDENSDQSKGDSDDEMEYPQTEPSTSMEFEKESPRKSKVRRGDQVVTREEYINELESATKSILPSPSPERRVNNPQSSQPVLYTNNTSADPRRHLIMPVPNLPTGEPPTNEQELAPEPDQHFQQLIDSLIGLPSATSLEPVPEQQQNELQKMRQSPKKPGKYNDL